VTVTREDDTLGAGPPGAPAAGDAGSADAARGDGGRRRRWGRPELVTIGIPALIAYLPLLLTHTGMVGADTKTYLYLDPGKLLSSAPYVWDSQIGLGTVTHQNIGYLFPMGPFYLVMSALHVPDWVAQRLWLGSVLLVAGMGVRYLLQFFNDTARAAHGDDRRVPFGPVALLVGSLAYMLSPYLLDYSARISVILLPWCALPWLIALSAKAVRVGGWRYPAWFAFVVAAVGGINATALILVGVGPLLWILHAVFVDRETSARDALKAIGRIGVLTLATNLWWIAGLWAEGRYGLPVIRYTESYHTVAEVSTATEALRGLGYWFFYGSDKLGPWIEPSVQYTQSIWLIVLSYALPITAMVAAAVIRWRYRAYFAGLMLVGTLIAVASHPWDDSSFLGGLFKAFTRTDAGLSLRSTPRAVPLIVLGTATFLAMGVEAFGRRVPKLAVPAGIAVCVLVAANIPPMWSNTMVASNLERPEDIPAYWNEDAAYLQARGNATRVLEIPGADFASYRWGNTVDPVLPGLMERSYVARELFQWGSPQSANLLNALDRRFHEDVADPDALAPLARLLGVGDINVRSDLQYERYRLARPKQLWDLLARTPGLGTPVAFGGTEPPNAAGPEFTLQDEVELGSDPTLPEPPKVAAFPVDDALPILRTQSASQPLLMAGDGEGLVDAASVNLVNPLQPIFYVASTAGDQATFDRIYGNGADLLLTDTNRKRARRWGALRENAGYTERADEVAPFDPTDQRLDVFPKSDASSMTVSQQTAAATGGNAATVTASHYGNPITYTPDDRPANVLDGDPLTAWRVGALSNVKDEQLVIDLERPLTAGQITLLQPINLERTRWITKARLVFEGPDGTSSEDIELGDQSRDETARTGQTFTFPERRFDKLTIQVLDTNLGTAKGWEGISGVGLAEVSIPGLDNQELVQLPTDLLTRAGSSSLDHRLSLLFTRLRSNPREPVRNDEEPALRRLFTLPTARSFAIGGQARLSGLLDADRPDAEIDRVLGLPDAGHGGVTAISDVHLPGDLRQRASAAIDGDPSTSWTATYQGQQGHYLDFTNATPLTFDHLDMAIVNDRRHSLPTQLKVTVDGVDQFTVDLPAIEPQDAVDGTAQVHVPLPHAVTGTDVRFTITGADEHRTDEWYSGKDVVLPISIAEMGVPGLHLAPAGPRFDTGCRTNLLTIDGRPVPIRVQGSTDDALDREPLPVEACTPDPTAAAASDAFDGAAIDLGAGDHVLLSNPGRDTGIDVDLDRLVFASDRGGAALDPADLPSEVPSGPPATDVSLGRVDGHVTVPSADEPFWLTLGQSWSTGWTATVNGQSLGAPTVINGYGNGWYVDPAVVGTGPLDIELRWTPQRVVWGAIGISLLGIVAALVLIARRPRRRAHPATVVDLPERPLTPSLALPWPLPARWSSAGASATVDRAALSDGSAASADATGDDVAGTRGGRRWHERPAGRISAAVVATVFAAFAVVNLPTYFGVPILAVPLGLVTYAGLRRHIPRGWLGLAGAGALAGALAYIVLQQVRHRYPADFEWPTWFEKVHVLGLGAVFLLAAETLRDLLPRPPRTAGGSTPDGPDAPAGSPDASGPDSPGGTGPDTPAN